MIFFLTRSISQKSTSIKYVEYIESTGTQYIDTGFKPNNTTRVVMDIQVIKSGTFPFFGARYGNANDTFTVWMMSASTVRSDFYDNSAIEVNVSNVLNRMTIDKNKNVCSFGGILATNVNGSFQVPVDLLLLGIDTNGVIDERKLSGRLYSCQIYDNGNLIRDYWPCLDENDVACLYDRVSDVYVYNSGSGVFVSGNII